MNLARNSLHDRILGLAALRLDGELAPVEVAELERHVGGCPVCGRRVAAMHSDASALSQPLDLLPSRRVDDAVYAAIVRRGEPARRYLLVAAVAAIRGRSSLGGYSAPVRPIDESLRPGTRCKRQCNRLDRFAGADRRGLCPRAVQPAVTRHGRRSPLPALADLVDVRRRPELAQLASRNASLTGERSSRGSPTM